MKFRQFTALLFLLGFGFLLSVLLVNAPLGGASMAVGQGILAINNAETGAANAVSGVLLAFRGLDTLGELTILFVAATAAGLVLGGKGRRKVTEARAGFVLLSGAELIFPFLLILGAYIITHGHLTPGGGFQGGTILAAAFFVPFLADPGRAFNENAMSVVEGLAGAAFIVIGLIGLRTEGAFLAPLLGQGSFGTLISSGSLPLLYLAVGLKVGAELGSLMAKIASTQGVDETDGEHP